MKRPFENEYEPYYAGYISKVEGEDILKTFEDQLIGTQEFLNSIPEEKENYSYSEGKWSVKEVVGHMVDVERVMAYRALSIARKEKKSLPGFEQDDYVAAANFKKRTLANLAEEFKYLRKSNIILFKNFDEEMLNQRGVANNFEITVLALLFIIAGHEKHHINILKEKYLV